MSDRSDALSRKLLRTSPAILLAIALVVGCASRPTPEAHCAEPTVVSYPPPPAEVERIDQPADPPCEWMDGSWEWLGRRWQWRPGAWVIFPPGCYRAAPIMVWLQSEEGGVLYYRRASFCPLGAADTEKQSRARCPNPKPCSRTPAATEPATPVLPDR